MLVVAAAIHRITGMGFALCATPILVLLYGPHDGVLVVTVTAMTASAIMLASRWRTVEWRRAATLVLPGLLIAPLGAIVTWHSAQGTVRRLGRLSPHHGQDRPNGNAGDGVGRRRPGAPPWHLGTGFVEYTSRLTKLLVSPHAGTAVTRGDALS